MNKKVNNYVIYHAFCDIFEEEPYDAEDKCIVEHHMSEMIRKYAKKHNIKITTDHNYNINGNILNTIEKENIDLIEHILKTEKPEKWEGISKKDEELFLNGAQWKNSFKKGDISPISNEEYKNVYQKLENKIQEKQNIIYGYKPPFIMKAISFIPMVKQIIDNNRQKYIVDSWNKMDENDKREYISNIIMVHCIEELKKT